MSEKDTMRLVLENFDPEAFLGFEYQEALDTTRTLVPAGWHEIYIEDFEIVKPRLFANKQTGEQEYSSPILSLKCPVENESIRAQLGYTDPERILYARIQVYLDILPTMALDFGPNKNLTLGRIREALGQNEEGVPWSFRNLRGSRRFYALCKHVPAKDDPEKVFERWEQFAGDQPEQAAA